MADIATLDMTRNLKSAGLWNEYGLLSSNYTGTITWGHSVVSLFAAFTAAMIAGAGYVGTQLTSLNLTSVAIYSHQIKLGDLLLFVTAVVGLSSSIWGAAMVLAHSTQALLILGRMKQLELMLEPIDEAQNRFAHQQLRYENRGVTSKFVKFSTSLILLSITSVWLAILLKALFEFGF